MKSSTKFFLFAAINFLLAAMLFTVVLICLPNLPIAIIVLDCIIIGYDIMAGIMNISTGWRHKRVEELYD